MARPRIQLGVGFCILAFSGFLISRAEDHDLSLNHAECLFFGEEREKHSGQVLDESTGAAVPRSRLSARTAQVTSALGAAFAVKETRPAVFADPQPGSIDFYLSQEMRAAGVQPAAKTNDYEFIRRVSLDLTGRIPKPDRVESFAGDPGGGKRMRLIDELLNSPEWADKWTMFFGDLYKNTDRRASTGLQRYPEGRLAFHRWIKDSLASNKPYNKMASELIAAKGDDSFKQGDLNWIIGGFVTGGPVQDVTDQQAANVAETFLGVSHMNCVLCHNGRGHLDSLSLWGKTTTRSQAWQFASYLSRTVMTRQRVDPSKPNLQYWLVRDSGARDYTLGSTTGNRPARSLPPGCRAGQPCAYVAPAYPFNGKSPAAGESYREALAREVTADPQFARATVNYIWAQFFGRGLVEPVNQFDPARLDPDNPPPEPWTLQPSNPRLLNALAQSFIDTGFNLKTLMRQIANSDAYQLSSRYEGQWSPAYEKYFARKFVRRLWAEEIHDAVIQSSGILPSYNVRGFSDLGAGNVTWAMQLPDTLGVPGGAVTTFLDAFLRGNRDDAERSDEGSLLQALNLMNDPLVTTRVLATGANPNRLISANLNRSDDRLVEALYLGILSRPPSEQELTKALAGLRRGDRVQGAQNVAWALYNKVDFLFNY